jgi:hypothetical protein
MPRFEPNVPIQTQEPVILVEVAEGQALLPGRHTFRLVVVDNDGLESDPDQVDIIVLDDRRPTAVLEVPRQVIFGQNFELSGRRSADPAPGRIVRYIWTLVG